MYICLHSCCVIVLDVFVLLLEDTVLIHRIRHDFPTVGNLQRSPQTLSFRVVRPCVREAFSEREGTGDVSFGGLNPGKTHGSIQPMDNSEINH